MQHPESRRTGQPPHPASCSFPSRPGPCLLMPTPFPLGFLRHQALRDNSSPSKPAAAAAAPQTPPASAHAASTSTPAASAAAAGPLSWDLQVFTGFVNAVKSGEGPMSALMRYMKGKLRNEGKNRALASDLLWSFCGMFSAVAALGVMNLYVRTWPVVGEWHQQVGACACGGCRGQGTQEGGGALGQGPDGRGQVWRGGPGH